MVKEAILKREIRNLVLNIISQPPPLINVYIQREIMILELELLRDCIKLVN